MSVHSKSNGVATPGRIPLRVTYEGRAATILLAEASGSLAQAWDATQSVLSDELELTGELPSAVVLLRENTLPRCANGDFDGRSITADFPRSRGYLREELLAWIVERLCQALFFQPSQFDPSQDWARYGVDSAVALEVIGDLEDMLGTRLPATLAECKNPEQVVTLATEILVDAPNLLPWWRSSAVTVELA